MPQFPNPMDNRTPLPEWIQSAYEILLEEIDDAHEGIPREDATHILAVTNGFPDNSADTEYALDRLLNRGYFYAVGDDLRVTDPTDLESTSHTANNQSPDAHSE